MTSQIFGSAWTEEGGRQARQVNLKEWSNLEISFAIVPLSFFTMTKEI